MSIHLVSDYACPACGSLLRKESSCKGMIVFCVNEQCDAEVTDNGAEAATEQEAIEKLKGFVDRELQARYFKEMSAEEEREEAALRKADYENHRDRQERR